MVIGHRERKPLEREDVMRLDMSGLRKPGCCVWYAGKHREGQEREMLLELTERWLAEHPEYRAA